MHFLLLYYLVCIFYLTNLYIIKFPQYKYEKDWVFYLFYIVTWILAPIFVPFHFTLYVLKIEL
jgi:hypothetical protein